MPRVRKDCGDMKKDITPFRRLNQGIDFKNIAKYSFRFNTVKAS
jgi:hypothetical protein